jgi:hypothetical protein
LPALEATPPSLPDGKALSATPIDWRGSMNDWSLGAPLASQQPGVYAAEMALAAGRHRFKIGSSDWRRIDLGAAFDDGASELGQVKLVAPKGGEFVVEVARAGLHRVTLDTRNRRAPALTITAVAAP